MMTDLFPSCSIASEAVNLQLFQLSLLLGEIGLNIQEAHAFSTVDGYSLDVFVVDGWPYRETEQLRKELLKEISKTEVVPLHSAHCYNVTFA
ncbi:hypothetical protein HHK36_031145 [Tetracentron sinense]|uniref:ACT domain-containing protein n=1 Tax=Tetracentron sinense TaxID=13715 RepID=A0A834YEA3_TETSI|nr:hypothetical protein HHK36_031145 [Tetracentron sinense]